MGTFFIKHRTIIFFLCLIKLCLFLPFNALSENHPGIDISADRTIPSNDRRIFSGDVIVKVNNVEDVVFRADQVNVIFSSEKEISQIILFGSPVTFSQDVKPYSVDGVAEEIRYFPKKGKIKLLNGKLHKDNRWIKGGWVEYDIETYNVFSGLLNDRIRLQEYLANEWYLTK